MNCPCHMSPGRLFACPRARRGFSFTEILFAVMILGIGFIMVAAMFPVAIHQTEDNTRDTIAASVGRAGYSVANELANLQVSIASTPSSQFTSSILLPTYKPQFNAKLFPYSPVPLTGTQTSVVIPGVVWSFEDARDTYGNVKLTQYSASSVTEPHQTLLWSLAIQNLIQASDNRYAWIPFYKRDLIARGGPGAANVQPVPAPFAQVILVGVRSQAGPVYNPAVDPSSTGPFIFTKPITGVQLTMDAASNWTINFPGGTPNVTENAYVIISDDNFGGLNNGRIYRIGTSYQGSSTKFYIAPGEGPSPKDTPLSNASVFVIGRPKDPNTGAFVGGAQDVAVYTTYVQTP